MSEKKGELKKRRLTLKLVRDYLRDSGEVLSSGELAKALGLSRQAIETMLYRMVQEAAGIAYQGKGPGMHGWRYVGPEKCWPYEAATPTIEELERYVAALEAEVARLGGSVDKEPFFRREKRPEGEHARIRTRSALSSSKLVSLLDGDDAGTAASAPETVDG